MRSDSHMGLFVFKRLADFLMTRKSTDGEPGKKGKEVNKESTERRLVAEELNTVRAALNSTASGVIITDKKGCICSTHPTRF